MPCSAAAARHTWQQLRRAKSSELFLERIDLECLNNRGELVLQFRAPRWLLTAQQQHNASSKGQEVDNDQQGRFDGSQASGEQ